MPKRKTFGGPDVVKWNKMEAKGPPSSGHVPKSIFSVESITLLFVLPFCNICGFLWIYTALPLHFVDSGWPLWQLSTLLATIYAPRLAVTMATSYLGDWICVPIAACGAALNIVMLMLPKNLTAVWMAVSVTNASLNPPAYRSLAYAHFRVRGGCSKEEAEQGQWQLQRALRLFTLADTLGYACAPFVGGLLYDYGGLGYCAWFASATCTVCTVFPLFLSAWRASLSRACCGRHKTTAEIYPLDALGEAEDAQAATIVAVEKENIAASDEEQGKGKGKGEDEMAVDMHHFLDRDGGEKGTGGKKDSGAAAVVEAADQAAALHADNAAAVAVVMACAFANIFTYGVEWSLYALYFRLQYGWSGAWCGFAQMVGDLLGAGVLGISTMSLPTRAMASAGGRAFRMPRLLKALVCPPFSLGVLACCHGALMVLLAQPHFILALIGQVLMGTVYVFFEQAVQEMLLKYSHGDHAYYRRLVSMHYLVFTAGCALPSPLALGLYEGTGDFAIAFYTAATIVTALGIGVNMFFWHQKEVPRWGKGSDVDSSR